MSDPDRLAEEMTMNEETTEPTVSAQDIPLWDAGWHNASTRYEVIERWLELAKVREVAVRDKWTGQIINRTVFYEGP